MQNKNANIQQTNNQSLKSPHLTQPVIRNALEPNAVDTCTNYAQEKRD